MVAARKIPQITKGTHDQNLTCLLPVLAMRCPSIARINWGSGRKGVGAVVAAGEFAFGAAAIFLHGSAVEFAGPDDGGVF